VFLGQPPTTDVPLKEYRARDGGKDITSGGNGYERVKEKTGEKKKKKRSV